MANDTTEELAFNLRNGLSQFGVSYTEEEFGEHKEFCIKNGEAPPALSAAFYQRISLMSSRSALTAPSTRPTPRPHLVSFSRMPHKDRVDTPSSQPATRRSAFQLSCTPRNFQNGLLPNIQQLKGPIVGDQSFGQVMESADGLLKEVSALRGPDACQSKIHNLLQKTCPTMQVLKEVDAKATYCVDPANRYQPDSQCGGAPGNAKDAECIKQIAKDTIEGLSFNFHTKLSQCGVSYTKEKFRKSKDLCTANGEISPILNAELQQKISRSSTPAFKVLPPKPSQPSYSSAPTTTSALQSSTPTSTVPLPNTSQSPSSSTPATTSAPQSSTPVFTAPLSRTSQSPSSSAPTTTSALLQPQPVFPEEMPANAWEDVAPAAPPTKSTPQPHQFPFSRVSAKDWDTVVSTNPPEQYWNDTTPVTPIYFPPSELTTGYTHQIGNATATTAIAMTTLPVWGVSLIVGGAVVGVSFVAYGGYKLGKYLWNRYHRPQPPVWV